MEKFDHQDYRDNLAKDIKELRREEPQKAAGVLETMQTTSNYKHAGDLHKQDKYYEKNKEQIMQKNYLNIIEKFSDNNENNYKCFSEIETLKEETGINLSPEVIHVGYVALLNTYRVGRSMEAFEEIVGVKPQFKSEEKGKIIFRRISAEHWSAFDDVIEYLGAGLEESVVEKCYEKLAIRLYAQMERSDLNRVVITIGQISKVYRETKIRAKLDQGKIQNVYQALLEEPLEEKFSGPADNVWIIDKLHEATGVLYPRFDRHKVEQLYNSLIKYDRYTDTNSRLKKFEEITGIDKRSSA